MTETIYSREQIERRDKNLKELKQRPRTEFNKRQALEALMDTIENTLESRSYREVASGLRDWGLDISEGSLKKYVSTYRRENAAKKSTRKRSERNKAASVNSAVSSQKTQESATEESDAKAQATENRKAASATKKKTTRRKSPATRKATSRLS